MIQKTLSKEDMEFRIGQNSWAMTNAYRNRDWALVKILQAENDVLRERVRAIKREEINEVRS